MKKKPAAKKKKTAPKKKAAPKKKIAKAKPKPAKKKKALKLKPKAKSRKPAAKAVTQLRKSLKVAMKPVVAEVSKAQLAPVVNAFAFTETEGKIDAKGLAMRAAQAAFDKKGFDVMVLDVAGRSPIADMMVIVSARSTTHVKSIADSIEKELANKGIRASKRERGTSRDADWILLDYFDVLIHVLVNEQRGQYKLETLYSGAKIIAEMH